MPGAGIQINDACLTEFEAFKLRGRYTWIVFRIAAENEVVIDSSSTPETDGLPGLVAALSRSEPRYAILNFKYNVEDGPRSKTVFVFSSPHDATTRQRMIYASTQPEFKRALNGVAVEINTSPEELDEASIKEKCLRFSR